MLSLKKTLNSPINLEWSDPDSCKWNHVSAQRKNGSPGFKLGTRICKVHFNLLRLIINPLKNARIFEKCIHIAKLPASFRGSIIKSLWVNGQRSKMSGGIDVIKNMTFLKKIWLHSNSFSGPLPDFLGLKNLESLSLRDNSFTGPVPISLVNLESLKVVNLTNNFLQGPMLEFKSSVKMDMTKKTNSFCLDEPGNCDSRVNSLLSIVKSMGYPSKFGENWKGNDPCADRPPETILTTK